MNKPAHTKMAPPSIRTDSRNDVTLIGFLTVLWHGKWTIFALTLAAAFLGWFYAARMAPIYTATAVVALEPNQQQIVDFQAVVPGLSGNEATVNTEIGVMRSRRLVGKLVDQLDMTGDPEFNAALRPKDESALSALIDPVVATISGTVQGLMQDFGLVEIEERTDTEPLLTERDQTITAVGRVLSVSNEPDSYLFTITAETEFPRKSAAVANKLAELYVLDQIEVKAEATERATTWLSERVSTLQAELEQASAELNAFRSETQVVSPEQLAVLDVELRRMRERARGLEAKLAEEQARVAALEQASEAGDIEAMITAAGDPEFVRLGRMVASGELPRATFDARFQRELVVARQNRDRTEAQLASVQAAVAERSVQFDQQSADMIRLREFERNAEATRLLYEYFLQRMKETAVQEGIQESDSRILSYAVPSPEPVLPRTGLMITVSAVLGLLIGSALVMLRESRHQGVRAASELEAATNHRVLAQIPLAPFGRQSNLFRYIAEEPSSAVAESVRALRTSLLISNIDAPPQVIMLTSAVPGDGKSSLSLALAQIMTGLEKRTLIIDCDIRRHGLTDQLGEHASPGIVSVLTGKADVQEAIFTTDTGFDVLLGSDLRATSANAADLFSSERFKSLLARMRQQYDNIIIDTPPVLAVPDSQIIGKSVDAIVFAVRWNATPIAQVLASVGTLESNGLGVTGFALTRVDPAKIRRYDYGSYGNAYGEYYSDGRGRKRKTKPA